MEKIESLEKKYITTKKIIESNIVNELSLFILVILSFYIFYSKNTGEIFDKIIVILLLLLFFGKFSLIDFLKEVYNEFNIKEIERSFILILLAVYLIKYPTFKNIEKNIIIILFISEVIFCLLDFIKSKIHKIKEREELKKIEEMTISSRLNEIKKLFNLIEDKEITTILVDNKIGNGKTYLIEIFLKKYMTEFEVIYIKLPLIKDIDELKTVIFNEFRNVFKKNRINYFYLKEMMKKISSFKSSYFEINMGNNTSNWEEIKQLKKSLKKLEDKNKKIIIIIDDIEREKNIELIKESIVFLGEFSEYFRDTKTTTIFLLQYNEILKRITSKKEDVSKDKYFKKEFLDKYFKYKLKLDTPKVATIKKEDLNKITKEAVKNSNRKIEEDKLEEYVDYIFNCLKIFVSKSDENNKKEIEINGDIRNLIKYIKKINVLLDKSLYSTFGIVYSIFIAFEIFLPNEREKILKDEKKLDEFINDIFDDLILNSKKFIYKDERIINLVFELYKNDELIDNFYFSSYEEFINYLTDKNIRKFDEKKLIDINFQEIKSIIFKLKNSEINKFFLIKELPIKKIEEISEILFDKILKTNGNFDDFDDFSIKNMLIIFEKLIDSNKIVDPENKILYLEELKKVELEKKYKEKIINELKEKIKTELSVKILELEKDYGERLKTRIDKLNFEKSNYKKIKINELKKEMKKEKLLKIKTFDKVSEEEIQKTMSMEIDKKRVMKEESIKEIKERNMTIKKQIEYLNEIEKIEKIEQKEIKEISQIEEKCSSELVQLENSLKEGTKKNKDNLIHEIVAEETSKVENLLKEIEKMYKEEERKIKSEIDKEKNRELKNINLERKKREKEVLDKSLENETRRRINKVNARYALLKIKYKEREKTLGLLNMIEKNKRLTDIIEKNNLGIKNTIIQKYEILNKHSKFVLNNIMIKEIAEKKDRNYKKYFLRNSINKEDSFL